MKQQLDQDPTSGKPFHVTSLKAYMFIRSGGNKLMDLHQKIKRLTCVQSTSLVGRKYDVVLKINAANQEDLTRIRSQLYTIKGIELITMMVITTEINISDEHKEILPCIRS